MRRKRQTRPHRATAPRNCRALRARRLYEKAINQLESLRIRFSSHKNEQFIYRSWSGAIHFNGFILSRRIVPPFIVCTCNQICMCYASTIYLLLLLLLSHSDIRLNERSCGVVSRFFFVHRCDGSRHIF